MGRIEYVYRWLDGLLDYDVCQGKQDGLLSKRIRDREPDRDFEAIEMEDAVWFELLITDCAIRRFTTATGRRPHALDELVPRFLNAIPLDPFADKPLTYRSKDRSYELYSYGRNRLDDGAVQSSPDSDLYLPTN